MQGRLTYPNSSILEENLLPHGQEEVASVQTPITSSGSSAGSGVAASIGLATITLGTKTDGIIITYFASNSNLAGIKPTEV
jgi:Asp-tRNA(Asn)/Glu-tRNA(Gln) amidotransferase A subunit family amidase